jgi:hypothetical protein
MSTQIRTQIPIVPRFIWGESDTEDEVDAVVDNFWTTTKKQEIVIPEKGWTTVKNTKSKSQSKDRDLNCKKCKASFLYSADQQKLYRKRGWKQPKLCSECVYERHQRFQKYKNK